MAKFYGMIGFQCQVEERPGIFKPKIKEFPYIGDVHRIYRRYSAQANKTNDDFDISNEISIIADPFALANFSNALYIYYLNQRWKISGVEVLYPRLKFSLGGVYNGKGPDEGSSCQNAGTKE